MTRLKKISITLCVIALFAFFSVGIIAPRTARAQLAVIDPSNFVQNTLTAINTTASSFSTYYMEYKESILDGLAWAIAKQVLQSMTADIVDWINSGFEGNPAFLTNPEGFFIDMADQATGVFLARAGPLQDLCSPFSLDIRLTLALSQAQALRTRYTCTLSTIINNVRNLPNSVTINGQPIGATMEGFLDGDFSQGGWPAFLALTTEPNNNIYGAYLSAHGDLLSSIASQQAQVRVDLSMGSGFMSWKKCEFHRKTSNYQEDIEAEKEAAANPMIRRKATADGGTIYEKCRTETPGSVISSSLSKQLGAGTDQLNMADEFNEIVNALIGQLVSQVLTGGLYSASAHTQAGSATTVVDRLRTESTNTGSLHFQRQEIINAIDRYKTPTEEYQSLRNEAFATLLVEKSIYDSALQCLMAKRGTAVLTNNNALINEALDRLNRQLQAVNSILIRYQNDASEGDKRLDALTALEDAVNDAQSYEDTSTVSQAYSQMIRERQLTTASDVQDAKADLEQAKNYAKTWHTDAQSFQSTCDSIQ